MRCSGQHCDVVRVLSLGRPDLMGRTGRGGLHVECYNALMRQFLFAPGKFEKFRAKAVASLCCELMKGGQAGKHVLHDRRLVIESGPELRINVAGAVVDLPKFAVSAIESRQKWSD